MHNIKHYDPGVSFYMKLLEFNIKTKPTNTDWNIYRYLASFSVVMGLYFA